MTGDLLVPDPEWVRIAKGGNPYHDDEGQFTHGPGGPSSGDDDEGEGGDGVESVPGTAGLVHRAAHRKYKDTLLGKNGATTQDKQQAKASDVYCSNAYKSINTPLYNGETPGKVTASRIARLDASFKNPRIAVRNAEEVKLYRGITDSEVQRMGDLAPGMKLKSPGFVSTSVRRSEVQTFRSEKRVTPRGAGMVIEMAVAPGTPMISGTPHEGEMILQRGTEMTVVEAKPGVLRVTV